jgi:hypothetical protein
MFRDASVSAGENSLDPKCKDKYHLRADQSMDRAVGTMPGFQEITQIVRILPPPPSWIGARLGHAKPQCFDDSRDSKNDSIYGARREMQRRRRHAPSCMGATDGQRNCPEMRKTLRKPGFLSGEDRNRTFGCFPNVFAQVRKVF